MLALGQTGLGAGRSDSCIHYLGVAQSINVLGLLFAAGAGALAQALVGASGFLDGSPIAPCVGVGRLGRALRVGVDRFGLCRRFLGITCAEYSKHESEEECQPNCLFHDNAFLF